MAVIRLEVPRYVQHESNKSSTCFPICVQQVLDYYGDYQLAHNILHDMPTYNREGRTALGQVGTYTLKQGYNTTIHTVDTHYFDPSWFLERETRNIIRDLELSIKTKTQDFDRFVMRGFISFLREGGKVMFNHVTKKLLMAHIAKKMPVIIGVDDCLLYKCKRSKEEFYDDDIEGESRIHAVVVSGYRDHDDRFHVVDPSSHNPFSEDGQYWVDAEELVANNNMVRGGALVIEQKPFRVPRLKPTS